jgi:hypothetical protein
MIDTSCNGFTNKATFDFAMYLQNTGTWDELVHYQWQEFSDNYSLSTYLVEMAEEMVGLGSTMGYSLRDRLLTTVLAQIDYYQLSERILADIEENQHYLDTAEAILKP